MIEGELKHMIESVIVARKRTHRESIDASNFSERYRRDQGDIGGIKGEEGPS